MQDSLSVLHLLTSTYVQSLQSGVLDKQGLLHVVDSTCAALSTPYRETVQHGVAHKQRGCWTCASALNMQRMQGEYLNNVVFVLKSVYECATPDAAAEHGLYEMALNLLHEKSFVSALEEVASPKDVYALQRKLISALLPRWTAILEENAVYKALPVYYAYCINPYYTKVGAALNESTLKRFAGPRDKRYCLLRGSAEELILKGINPSTLLPAVETDRVYYTEETCLVLMDDGMPFSEAYPTACVLDWK